MLDDTCYFLSFDNLANALITAALLNSNESINFLKSIAFLDSKRPYTKEILRRIDFAKLSELVDYTDIAKFVRSMPGDHFVCENDYHEYRHLFNTLLFDC